MRCILYGKQTEVFLAKRGVGKQSSEHSLYYLYYDATGSDIQVFVASNKVCAKLVYPLAVLPWEGRMGESMHSNTSGAASDRKKRNVI